MEKKLRIYEQAVHSSDKRHFDEEYLTPVSGRKRLDADSSVELVKVQVAYEQLQRTNHDLTLEIGKLCKTIKDKDKEIEVLKTELEIKESE